MLTVKCLVFGLHVIAQQNHEGEHTSLCVSQILFIFTFSLTSFFKTHGSTRVKPGLRSCQTFSSATIL